MSVASYTHDKKLMSDPKKPIFIVRMPLAKTGKMLGTTFIEGVGQTTYADKAQEFDEQFGYEVVLPKGFKPWENAELNERVTAIDRPEDYIDTDEEPR